MIGNQKLVGSFILVTVWIGTAAVASADTVPLKTVPLKTVHLKNGQSFTGRILPGDGPFVVLEINKSGIKLTRKFDRRDVVRIEKGKSPTAPAPKPKIQPKATTAGGEKKSETKATTAPAVTPTQPSLRLYLRYGIGRTASFFPEAIRDERVVLEPGRKRIFVQLPLAYTLSDKKRSITRGALRVKTAAGRTCPLKGIRLTSNISRNVPSLLDDTTGPAPTPPQTGRSTEIESPRGDDPIWERIIPKRKNGSVYLECYNTSHPKKPRGEQTVGGGRQNRQPVAGGRQKRQRRSRFEMRKANGLALFLLEMPEDAESLVCTVQSDPPVTTTVPVDLLRSLEAPQFDAKPEVLAGLSSAIASADGPVAEALLGQLARALSTINPTGNAPNSPEASDKPDPVSQGFLAGLGHTDPSTRESAWNMLIRGGEISQAVLDRVATSDNKRVYETIQQGATEAVARAKRKAEAQDSAIAIPVAAAPGTGVKANPNIVPSKLPNSLAPKKVFRLLGAALRNKHAGKGSEVVDLILADATKQSISALANVSLGVQGTAIGRLASISSPDLAVTTVKTLLLAPHPTLAKPLLDAALKMKIKIVDPNDPLVTAPERVKDPAVKATLLSALAQLPLEAVFDSREVEGMLKKVAGPDADPRVQVAAIGLIQRHWQPAVGLPAASRRSAQFGVVRGRSSLSDILLGIILAEKVDPQAAAAAAGTLAMKGRAEQAAAEIDKLPAATRVALLDKLAAAGLKHPRVAAFLATQAGAEDAAVALSAMRGLDKMIQAAPDAQRWMLASELKAGLDFNQVIKHTDARDAESSSLAELTYRVIAAGVSLSPEQAKLLRDRANAPSRATYLSELDYAQAEKPAGDYHAILYADIQLPLPPPGQTADGRPLPPTRAENIRYDVPYDLGQVRISQGENDQLTARFGKQDVAMQLQSSRGAPGTIDMNATLGFDGAPVVLAALARSPQGAVLAGLVGGLFKGENNPLANTKLEYVAFGRWQSRINFPAAPSKPGSTPTSPPMWIKECRLVLGPVGGPPNPSTPKPGTPNP